MRLLEQFPLGSTNLSTLEELNFSKCLSSREILEGVDRLSSLGELKVWECEALEVFLLE